MTVFLERAILVYCVFYNFGIIRKWKRSEREKGKTRGGNEEEDGAVLTSVRKKEGEEEGRLQTVERDRARRRNQDGCGLLDKSPHQIRLSNDFGSLSTFKLLSPLIFQLNKLFSRVDRIIK
ncbi:hypothetical protein CCACVL1_12420, partial [Corchorus capsularis]